MSRKEGEDEKRKLDEDEKRKLEDLLKEATRRGKWEQVVEVYEEKPKLAQNVKLNLQGDTALHLAVIDNQEEIVEKMVHQIGTSPDKNTVLSTRNERDNTPLHLAAVMGSVRMCHAIVSAHPGLVDMRNKADETPLFLAAVYGNTDAFYCLYYYVCDDAKITANCRVNKEGDTVLHRALSNEQFDLAFQLIHMHKDSMSWVNQQGFTPLHVLASKPTSFKTGSHIKGWRNIVYYGTFVNQLKPQPIQTIYDQRVKPSVCKAAETTPPSCFPLNYQTCTHFFTKLTLLFLIVIGAEKNKKKEQTPNPKPQAKKEKDLEMGISEEKFPINYSTCIDFFQFALSAIMILLGFGSGEIRKIRKKKQKHTWAIQVMDKLIESVSNEKSYNDGGPPASVLCHTNQHQKQQDSVPYHVEGGKVKFNDPHIVNNNNNNNDQSHQTPKDHGKPADTPMLLAAQNGAIDIVRALFHQFPLAIRDTRSDKKNVVLLAAQFRQPEVYRFLLKKRKDMENLFRAVDENGNSALHLAATALDPKLWLITGAAFQMQWEVKWYKYVEESVPLHFFGRYNKKGETADEIFRESHMDLVAKGGDWLYKTSESCSLVATLIATVAFATAVTVPGGNNEEGEANFKTEQAFFIFSISSLVALCLSSTSMIMFLGILTSRFPPKDFGSVLPWKLLTGLSCLYVSIIAMLVSFCSGHYFLILNRLHNSAVLLYTLIFLPVAFIFGIVQLPLYFDLLQAILKLVPKRSATVICLLMDSHKVDEAIAELSRAIAFKADLHLLHLRAAFHENTNDVLAALQDCRAALSVDPNHQEMLELHSRVNSHEP